MRADKDGTANEARRSATSRYFLESDGFDGVTGTTLVGAGGFRGVFCGVCDAFPSRGERASPVQALLASSRLLGWLVRRPVGSNGVAQGHELRLRGRVRRCLAGAERTLLNAAGHLTPEYRVPRGRSQGERSARRRSKRPARLGGRENKVQDQSDQDRADHDDVRDDCAGVGMPCVWGVELLDQPDSPRRRDRVENERVGECAESELEVASACASSAGVGELHDDEAGEQESDRCEDGDSCRQQGRSTVEHSPDGAASGCPSAGVTRPSRPPASRSRHGARGRARRRAGRGGRGRPRGGRGRPRRPCARGCG